MCVFPCSVPILPLTKNLCSQGLASLPMCSSNPLKKLPFSPMKSYMATLHNPTYLLKNMKQIPKRKNPCLPKSIVLKLRSPCKWIFCTTSSLQIKNVANISVCLVHVEHGDMCWPMQILLVANSDPLQNQPLEHMSD